MIDVNAELVKTALRSAATATEHYLNAADRITERNIHACRSYLRAAQSAIEGLEREADEILIEAKSVTEMLWTDDTRAALRRRIDTYLHVDVVRLQLARAVAGIDACHGRAVRDATSWLRGSADKKRASDNLLESFGALKSYLESLHSTLGYSVENNVGPSGVLVPILLELRKLLEPARHETPTAEQERQQRVRGLASEAQVMRRRNGLRIAENASRTIQELSMAFRLASMSADGVTG